VWSDNAKHPVEYCARSATDTAHAVFTGSSDEHCPGSEAQIKYLPLLYPTFSPAFAIPQARIPEFPIDRKSTVRASVRYGQTWLVELMRYE